MDGEEKDVRKKKEKPPACCFVVPCWVPKYLIFLFPLFCLLPPAPQLSRFVLVSPRLCRQRSWGRRNLSRRGFCLSTSPLCSVLLHLSSVFPPALSCSGGTLWPSSSAVSRSALQAGFRSLRSYCSSCPFFFSLFHFLFLATFSVCNSSTLWRNIFLLCAASLGHCFFCVEREKCWR